MNDATIVSIVLIGGMVLLLAIGAPVSVSSRSTPVASNAGSIDLF